MSEVLHPKLIINFDTFEMIGITNETEVPGGFEVTGPTDET